MVRILNKQQKSYAYIEYVIRKRSFTDIGLTLGVSRQTIRRAIKDTEEVIAAYNKENDEKTYNQYTTRRRVTPKLSK